MNVYKFGWNSAVPEEYMIAEVYGNSLDEAKKTLDIIHTDIKTLKLVSIEPYITPTPGKIKFYGSFDDYLDLVENLL